MPAQADASATASVQGRSPLLRWLASLVLVAVIAVAAIYGINRYLYGALVSDAGRAQSVRLMTWNIGKIYLPLDSRAADKDLDHVARVIRDVDADLVALQEMRGPVQLGRLLALLGPSWRGRVPSDAYDRRAALLSRLPARFVDFETSTGRTAQGAEIVLPDGSLLAVTSIHLDAFDAERRTRQAEEILISLARLGYDDVVLAGDFNFDATAVAHDTADDRLYHMLTREFVDAGIGEGGTTLIAQRLDYVFYRSKRVVSARIQVLQERRINIMDHDPLLAELSLRAGPPAP